MHAFCGVERQCMTTGGAHLTELETSSQEPSQRRQQLKHPEPAVTSPAAVDGKMRGALMATAVSDSCKVLRPSACRPCIWSSWHRDNMRGQMAAGTGCCEVMYALQLGSTCQHGCGCVAAFHHGCARQEGTPLNLVLQQKGSCRLLRVRLKGHAG